MIYYLKQIIFFKKNFIFIFKKFEKKSKLIVNIWACLCLAFMASYTANLAAFMIIKEEYPDLKGVFDSRVNVDEINFFLNFNFSIFFYSTI
jgi:hypothetical protein